MVGNIILYFVVALVMVIFSFMAVKTTKILRAAAYLLFVLLGSAVFYFQLGYQFLGAVQVAVYAGGIMVLFVFAILLTNRPNDDEHPLRSHRRVLGMLASVAGTVFLLWSLFTMPMVEGEGTLSQRCAGRRPRHHDEDDRPGIHRHRKVSVSAPVRGCQRPAAGLHHRWSDSGPKALIVKPISIQQHQNGSESSLVSCAQRRDVLLRRVWVCHP